MPPVWNRTDYGGDFLAVDPLTAKILAKVAMQAATDSESRKRILFMILAPVIGLLLLIAFILYLITSPFSVLSQWLIGDEVNVVEDFQKQYGYNLPLCGDWDFLKLAVRQNHCVIFSGGDFRNVAVAVFGSKILCGGYQKVCVGEKAVEFCCPLAHQGIGNHKHRLVDRSQVLEVHPGGN